MGDYSASDPTMSVSLSPQSGLNLSPYAINIDPSLWGKEEEFVFTAESTKQRSVNEKLFLRTGTSYLTGLSVGGTWGLYQGLRSREGRTLKLRVNSVLNALTRRGPFVANNLAVLAVMYSCIDGLAIKARDGQDDIYNSVGSAICTGLLFKCTSGPRAVLFASALGGGLALTVWFGRYAWENRRSFFPARSHY
ncbi:uncharacterized protein [Oscarella lobularis]|uniref:uncharacterized protein n=1 Tax=Oscarella lobularis TaxID=121494 RepID=UPI0033133962